MPSYLHLLFDPKLFSRFFPKMFSYRVIPIYVGRIKSIKKLIGSIEKPFLNNYETILIQVNKKTFSFTGWYHGDLTTCFFNKHYVEHDITGLGVIDVGANIADSTISFINQRASHVIGVEPNQEIYEYAEKNVNDNNVKSKVTLLKAGISDSTNVIKIKKNSKNNTGAGFKIIKTENEQNSEKLQLYSLSDLADMLPNKPLMLKMDCEGAEYEVFATSEDDTIKRFKLIIMEYHNGSDVLVKRLEDLGFTCTIETNFDQKNRNEKGKTGYIIAKNQNIISN